MEKNSRFFIFKVVVLGIFLSVISALAAMKFLFSISTINMPDFTGIKFEEASNSASKMGLELKIEDEVDSNVYEAGLIVSQSVKPRAKIKKGRVIYITLSRGSKIVAVPDLTGVPKARAVLRLKNADLQEGFEAIVSSNIYKEDTIISQSPAPGEQVPFNTRINLLRSGGKKGAGFLMPDIKEKNVSEIFAILKKNELFVETLTITDDPALPSGTIIAQSPEPGYLINQDSPINLTATRQEGDTRLRRRMIKINHTLSGVPSARLVKITVLSLNGSETIYNEITLPDRPITVEAAVRGSALVQIFLGTQLVREIEYPPGS